MNSKKRKVANGRVSDQSTGLLVAAYYFTITVFALASMFPENRIWGINQWAYFSEIWRILIICAGLLLPPVWSLLKKSQSPSLGQHIESYLKGRRNYIFVSAAIIVMLGLSFYFLRGEVHFLGDGYLNLASLASESPLIKNIARGEVLAHIWVKSLVSGGGEKAALLSFQIISILSGIIMLTLISFMSRRIFENRIDSLMFTLGIASSGFMLLSFGYVEYYSLFVLSVAIYVLGGLLIVNDKLNKWFIIPLLIFPVIFHGLGVTLIPSSLFILLSGTKFYDLIQKLTNRTKWIMILVGAVLFMTTFVYFYTSNYSFRFAVLPVLPDRFTVEGYTLFSINHVIDFLNLLLLLVPGLLIFLVLLPNLYSKGNLSQKPYQYLVILMLSTLGAVFLIDPRLGMPRDWDLLSFSGVPLAAFVYYSILDNRQLVRRYMIVSVIIVVGFFSLLPRAVRQHIPELAVAEFKTYAKLDIIKNRVGRNLLIDYYNRVGETRSANNETSNWYRDFPERLMLLRADSLFRTQMTIQAVRIVKQIIKKNPYYVPAYYALGRGYLDLREIDSAIVYLEIANAMNSHNPDFLNALARAYIAIKDYEYSEEVLLKSIRIDSKPLEPHMLLLATYEMKGDENKYHIYLSKIVERSDIPSEILVKYIANLIKQSDIHEALAFFERAIKSGLDSVQIRLLEESHPQLRQRELDQ